MAVNYTHHTLDKLKQILDTLRYKVRYDKGNLKTGACIVENSKMVVANKFSSVESRITSIITLIKKLDVDLHLLSEMQVQFLHAFKQTQLGC